MFYAYLFSIWLLTLNTARGHTWVEQLSVVDDNGNLIGDSGFIRGFVPRTDPAFADIENTYLLPKPPSMTIEQSDLICKETQSQGNQTKGPILTAPGGSRIVLRYLENGHVTQPYNPPNKPSSGRIFVYATTQAAADDRLVAVHGQWTTDRTGGDRRGFLLSMIDFDDGKCFQFDPTQHSAIAVSRNANFGPGSSAGEAPNRWCETILTLEDENSVPFASGTLLTLYWVWDWPSMLMGNPGAAPSILNETYTSCMDVAVE